MLPYLPLKNICSYLSTAEDKLNLQRAVGQRLSRRTGPDTLTCPLCTVNEFMLLSKAQSETMWFERHNDPNGDSSFVRVDRRLLEGHFLNHCSLLARSKVYKNFAELSDHLLTNHQVIKFKSSYSICIKLIRSLINLCILRMKLTIPRSSKPCSRCGIWKSSRSIGIIDHKYSKFALNIGIFLKCAKSIEPSIFPTTVSCHFFC